MQFAVFLQPNFFGVGILSRRYGNLVSVRIRFKGKEASKKLSHFAKKFTKPTKISAELSETRYNNETISAMDYYESSNCFQCCTFPPTQQTVSLATQFPIFCRSRFLLKNNCQENDSKASIPSLPTLKDAST